MFLPLFVGLVVILIVSTSLSTSFSKHFFHQQRFLHANAYSSTHDFPVSLPLVPTLSYSPGRRSVDPPEIPRNCFPLLPPPTFSAIAQAPKKAAGITLFPLILLLHRQSQLLINHQIHHSIKYFKFTYCLSMFPLKCQLITPQNKLMPALSRPLALQAIIYIHPCISSILFNTKKIYCLARASRIPFAFNPF